MEQYFIFTNFIENSISLIPQFDLYIITSKREGGPSSLLEAMAQKVPIVSTKVGVVTEAIEHNKNGLLSNIKDYKSLASNIYKLLNNSHLQNKFKEKSYQIIQNKFTTKHLTYQTLKIYKEILNDK